MSEFSISEFTPATSVTKGQPICSAVVKNESETGILAMGVIDTITGELIGWGESGTEIQAGKQAKVDMLVTGDIVSPSLRFIVGYIENGEFKITDKVDFNVALVPAIPSPYNVLIPVGILVIIVLGYLIIKKNSAK